MSGEDDSVKQNDKNIEEHMTFSPVLRKTPFWNIVGFLDMISRHLSEHFVQITSLQIVIVFNNTTAD